MPHTTDLAWSHSLDDSGGGRKDAMVTPAGEVPGTIDCTVIGAPGNVQFDPDPEVGGEVDSTRVPDHSRGHP